VLKMTMISQHPLTFMCLILVSWCFSSNSDFIHFSMHMDCNIVYQVGSVQKNVVTQHSPNFLDAGPNLQFDQHDRV